MESAMNCRWDHHLLNSILFIRRQFGRVVIFFAFYFPPPPGFLTTAMAAAVSRVNPPKIGEIRSKGRLPTAMPAITRVNIAFMSKVR